MKDPERRHTWPQRLLIVFNASLVVASLGAASTFGYFYVQFGRLPHASLPGGILSGTDSSSDPQNFLLVGSDSRAFVDDSADRRSFGGDAGPPRADTIMLVRVDPRSHHAWVLSLPRDLYLPIAPKGTPNKINTAYGGGAEQLIKTITDNFGIPIHHYAEINFKGLQQVVDAVGGVKIYLASPVRDYDVVEGRNQTGLLLLESGCVLLHGDQALAYVRSRHFQYQQADKSWVSVEGDLDRNARQQDFVRRTLRAALSKGLTNPARINRLANAAHGNLQISKSLNMSELVKLGRNFRSLAPDTMTQLSLPVSLGRSTDGQSILRILDKDKPAAEAMLQIFRGTPQEAAAAPAAPSSVNVRVMNGSGTAGQAGDASSALSKVGFSTMTPGDNTARTTRTVVRYGPGQDGKAALLASYLDTAPTLLSTPGLKGVDVELVTGGDFTGVRETARPATPASTTTSVAAATPPPAPDC